MTRYLWTGESEFCICGHHVTDHETLQWPISLTERPVVICRGGNNKVGIINSCDCNEFRPYRIATTEEVKQVIEKQYLEVKNIK
jgi:hypothetical protein